MSPYIMPGLKKPVEVDLKALYVRRPVHCSKTVRLFVWGLYPRAQMSKFNKKARMAGRTHGLNDDDICARHLYCFMMKKHIFPFLSLKIIGQTINDSYDHSSVIHALRATQNRIDTKEITLDTIEMLKNQIINRLNEDAHVDKPKRICK